ncbi:hypothetical protein JST99_00775 [Candidatus Dependentiae bacterium]|nr:hypothetical protein [Candidatus Dependentiae bacterium]MCC7415328.1 hypothetical protein [Campylobacterota bacterium]
MHLKRLGYTYYGLRIFVALFLPIFCAQSADTVTHKRASRRFKSPYPQKKRLPSPVAQQQPASEDHDAFFIPLSSLERVHRFNKEGDPLIADYDRNNGAKKYQKNDCLAFFVRLKKSRPDADIDPGIITASYFFYPKQYVCSVYRPHNPNGKLQQYLANDTFDVLKELFAQQEKQEKMETALKKLADEQCLYEELERNTRNLCKKVTMHLKDTSITP